MQDTNMCNLFTYIIEKKKQEKKKEFSSFNIIITTIILSLHIEKFHSKTCLNVFRNGNLDESFIFFTI